MNNNPNLWLKLISLLFLVAFGFLSVQVLYLPANLYIQNWDTTCLKFAETIRNAYLTSIFKFITNLGSTTFLTAAGAVLVLIPKLRKNYGFAVVLPLAAASLLNTGFKHLIMRSRPQAIPHLVIEHTYSFPSGHTTSSIVFYMLMAYFTYKLLKIEKNRTSQVFLKVLFLILIFLPFLIAISRIYLGVHFPSDVLAGIFLGLFFTFATIGFSPFFHLLKKS